jgi:hypothetical protein
MNINPIYDRYFPAVGRAPEVWNEFKDYRAEIGAKKDADFSTSTKTTWQETAKKILVVVLKIVIFPWGLYEGIKYLLTRIAMKIINPAQNQNTQHFREIFETALRAPSNEVFIEREVILEKDGVKYRGVMLGTRATISNGKWCAYAIGNAANAEMSVLGGTDQPFFQAGYNLLVMNGPGVGGSKGRATPVSLGETQDLAVTFLESAVKAKKIVLAGFSLGGASMGQGIMKHQFRPDVSYLALRMMTFDRLSSIVNKFGGIWAKKILLWLDLEMDSVKVSKKLQELNVHEIVVQGGRDEIMQDVGLLETLQREGVVANKTLLPIANATHDFLPREVIRQELARWDAAQVAEAARIAG